MNPKDVCIDWETAEFLAVLSGQTDWGNKVRRRQAAAKLGEAMGKRQMSTSRECFSDEPMADPVGKALKQERRLVLELLRSHPNTEHLIAAYESGEYRKKDKK